MTKSRHCVLALALATSLASGFSCADDDDPEQGPTQEEMLQVAADVCEHGIGCGYIDAITLEECTAYQVDAYQAAPECLAVYYFNECLSMLTCEDAERLEHNIDIGSCKDERDEAGGLSALCVPQ